MAKKTGIFRRKSKGLFPEDPALEKKEQDIIVEKKKSDLEQEIQSLLEDIQTYYLENPEADPSLPDKIWVKNVNELEEKITEHIPKKVVEDEVIVKNLIEIDPDGRNPLDFSVVRRFEEHEEYRTKVYEAEQITYTDTSTTQEVQKEKVSVKRREQDRDREKEKAMELFAEMEGELFSPEKQTQSESFGAGGGTVVPPRVELAEESDAAAEEGIDYEDIASSFGQEEHAKMPPQLNAEQKELMNTLFSGNMSASKSDSEKNLETDQEKMHGKASESNKDTQGVLKELFQQGKIKAEVFAEPDTQDAFNPLAELLGASEPDSEGADPAEEGQEAEVGNNEAEGLMGMLGAGTEALEREEGEFFDTQESESEELQEGTEDFVNKVFIARNSSEETTPSEDRQTSIGNAPMEMSAKPMASGKKELEWYEDSSLFQSFSTQGVGGEGHVEGKASLGVDGEELVSLFRESAEGSDSPTMESERENSSPTVESERENSSPTVESEKENSSPTVESERENSSPTVESERENSSPTVESERENSSPTVESERENSSPTVESKEEDSSPLEESDGRDSEEGRNNDVLNEFLSQNTKENNVVQEMKESPENKKENLQQEDGSPSQDFSILDIEEKDEPEEKNKLLNIEKEAEKTTLQTPVEKKQEAEGELKEELSKNLEDKPEIKEQPEPFADLQEKMEGNEIERVDELLDIVEASDEAVQEAEDSDEVVENPERESELEEPRREEPELEEPQLQALEEFQPESEPGVGEPDSDGPVLLEEDAWMNKSSFQKLDDSLMNLLKDLGEDEFQKKGPEVQKGLETIEKAPTEEHVIVEDHVEVEVPVPKEISVHIPIPKEIPVPVPVQKDVLAVREVEVEKIIPLEKEVLVMKEIEREKKEEAQPEESGKPKEELQSEEEDKLKKELQSKEADKLKKELQSEEPDKSKEELQSDEFAKRKEELGRGDITSQSNGKSEGGIGSGAGMGPGPIIQGGQFPAEQKSRKQSLFGRLLQRIRNMFKKNPPNELPGAQDEVYQGEGGIAEIIIEHRDLQIRGVISGGIIGENIVINTGALVKKDVEAKGVAICKKESTIMGSLRGVEVIVEGVIRGNVYASQKLEVADSALIIGDIYSPQIVVEKEAIIQGSLFEHEMMSDTRKEV